LLRSIILATLPFLGGNKQQVDKMDIFDLTHLVKYVEISGNFEKICINSLQTYKSKLAEKDWLVN